MLRYLTAGESHGKALVVIIDGFPAGLTVDAAAINQELKRRQGGYGRGGRQKLEADKIDIVSGTWQGTTLGSPITFQIVNNDYKLERLKELERPRPGHGDLSGSIKYLSSMRGVLERASARETAARVAAGALAVQLLREFGIEALGFTAAIGPLDFAAPAPPGPLASLRATRDTSIVYSLDPERDGQARQLIDQTADAGDTLGGIIETRVSGIPFGLGSHTQWDKKLDGKLAQAVMSIQAIKGVEIGMGLEVARRKGSEVHDPIGFDPATAATSGLGYQRATNNAGGLEAGMTNGQEIVIRAAMKPISTLRQPLDSIHMETKQPQRASYERSDVCAVSAASVIMENVVAFELAAALIEKFSGDSILEMKSHYEQFLQLARKR